MKNLDKKTCIILFGFQIHFLLFNTPELNAIHTLEAYFIVMLNIIACYLFKFHLVWYSDNGLIIPS